MRPLLLSLLATLAACGAQGTRGEPLPEPPRVEPPGAAPALPGGAGAAPAVTAPLEVDEDEASVMEPAAADEELGAGPEDSSTDTRLPLGWVAGSPIEAEDLLVEWYRTSARELWLLVDKLVATRIAFAEAQRLGIRLVPEEVELFVAEEKKGLAADVEERFPGLSLAEFVVRELGMEPDRYFDGVRAGAIRQMVAERAVRTWTLSNETLRVRVIVVPTTEKMDAVRAELAAGADFAEVARAHSVDDTSAQGGLLPYLVRQEHAPLTRLAFATPVGEVGGPLSATGYEFLVRVEEMRAPMPGPWSVVSGPVAASLAENPVLEAEFLHWKLAMEKRYAIDMSPLTELVGSNR